METRNFCISRYASWKYYPWIDKTLLIKNETKFNRIRVAFTSKKFFTAYLNTKIEILIDRVEFDSVVVYESKKQWTMGRDWCFRANLGKMYPVWFKATIENPPFIHFRSNSRVKSFSPRSVGSPSSWIILKDDKPQDDSTSCQSLPRSRLFRRRRGDCHISRNFAGPLYRPPFLSIVFTAVYPRRTTQRVTFVLENEIP